VGLRSAKQREAPSGLALNESFESLAHERRFLFESGIFLRRGDQIVVERNGSAHVSPRDRHEYEHH
jgi:hypothetical protein